MKDVFNEYCQSTYIEQKNPLVMERAIKEFSTQINFDS